MEYERCLINYADYNETPIQSIFFENDDNQNEKGFLEDSFEKTIIKMNPSFNSTSNTSFNNVQNISSNSYINLNNTPSIEYNNYSINISSNENNNFSINSKEEKEEGEITDVCVDNQEKKKKKRERKKKEIKDKKLTNQGRKKKEEAMNCNTKRNKYAKDNIFRKIKTKFLNKFLVSYINEKINCVYKKQKYLVRKFNKALVTDVSILFNIDLFNSRIRNLLNQEISDKYSTIELDENKMILRELEKNPEFGEFLDYSVNDIYFNLFLNDNYKEIISNDFKIDKEKIDFENITGIIEELREQGEDEEYLDRFKYYAYNINELMDESKKRSQRKPKININPNDN